ncbi:MAG: uroporphyrinogen-III synthase [Rikenellaceae bacterium]
MSANIKKILVSQPEPAIKEKSPFYELSTRLNLEIDYHPLIKVEGVLAKEFRAQRLEILDHTAIIFTSRTTIDSFFSICENSRITVPETMKYICQTEAVALYLQKYIVYRKRKISFGDGTFTKLIELIVKNRGEKFMLTLTEPHKPELPEALEKLGLNFSEAILARTISSDVSGVDMGRYDLVSLYSPSDVKALMENYKPDQLPMVAVFGRGTLAAAINAGLSVKAMAPTPEAPSMVKAVELLAQHLKAGDEVADVVLPDDSSQEEFLKSQQNKLAKRKRTTRAADASSK